MDAVLRILRRRRLWPAWIALGGILLLLPWLGAPGFWEPQEIKVADDARAQLERYSLADITRQVATHYRVKESDLKLAERNDRQTEARNLALYLADLYTEETYSDLRQAFAVDKHEVVESVIKGMRERLGNEAEVELRANRKAVEELLEKSERARARTSPPLTEWAIARGLDSFGWDEWGARLPLALMGLALLIATYFLGQRLAGPRVGLFAALIMMSFPLFVLQSRQLTSDIGAVLGQTLMMLGLVGLSWPAGDRRAIPIGVHIARYAGDVALLAAGTVITYYAAGALLGLLAPLAALALANPIAVVADRRAADDDPEHPDTVTEDDRTWSRLHLLAAGVFIGVAAVAVLGWLLGSMFDLTDPIPGQRQIFGHSWQPEPGYIDALGGGWKVTGDLSQDFDSMFRQIAFGLFPWSALAPIALLYVASGNRRGRRSWAGYAMFLWATTAWAFATIMNRKVGPVHYPALAAVAVGVAMWLDDVCRARELASSADADDDVVEADRAAFKLTGMHARLAMAAMFAAVAAVALAKDVTAFPEMLTSVHMLGQQVAYPEGLWLTKGVLAFGMLFGACLGAGLWLWARPRDGSGWWHTVKVECGRWGIPAALGVGVVFAVFLAQVWTPTLSKKLSSKHLFSVYHEFKQPGDRLGVMGNHGNGPKYYAGDSFTRLRNRSDLLEFLRQPEPRAFALVPDGELCPVRREGVQRDLSFFVVDDSHARFLLMTNQLRPGEKDVNPLREIMLRSKPPNVGRQVVGNFDGKIELLGVDMPQSVGRGDKFQVTLYFKVLEPVGGAWKIFAHFDTGGIRFQGDHDPIEGRCSTAFWQKGDYIVDRFTVEAGDVSYPRGNYQLRVGFFQGAHGSWKNMAVTKGQADGNNRLFVGNIRVD